MWFTDSYCIHFVSCFSPFFYLIITCILFLALRFSVLSYYNFSMVSVKFFVLSLINVMFIVAWTFCCTSYICLYTWYWILGWSAKKLCVFPFCLSSLTVFNTLVANFTVCKQNTHFTLIGGWCFCLLKLLLVMVVLFYNLLSYFCKRNIFQCMYFGNFYWYI